MIQWSFAFNCCQREGNFSPFRWTLGIRDKNTDFKLNYCQGFLHKMKKKINGSRTVNIIFFEKQTILEHSNRVFWLKHHKPRASFLLKNVHSNGARGVIKLRKKFFFQCTDVRWHLRIIKPYRKLLLFNNIDSWRKKNTGDCFPVMLGSYDGTDRVNYRNCSNLPRGKK